jgi:hypothetical protein
VPDMVEPGEVVDVGIGMWTEEIGDIDCEGGKEPSEAVCNERCGKLSRYKMLDRIRNSNALNADLDMCGILRMLKDCLMLSKLPENSRKSREPPKEYLGRFGCDVGS